MGNYEDNSKWIMPPGLLECASLFEKFFKSIFNSSSGTKTAPIIIYGPRGSGKTLFTKIFEKLYRTKHPEIKDEQIVRLNIAALPQSLVESELFGYIGGAFTGASSKGKPGLVENAKGGVLILEEIGELTKPEQAKLLTFIEDRIYYKVGAAKPEKWPKDKDIQIICTTNRKPDQTDNNGEKVFREDFLDRFYCYSVSPIHERRGDVLYYLFQTFPEVIQSLQPDHVLSLLAYNWPGNVREIERVGQYIKMVKEGLASWFPSGAEILWDHNFMFPTMIRTSLDIFKVKHLGDCLRGSGFRVGTLERELNKYGLGFPRPDNRTAVFNKKLETIELQDEGNKFGVKCYKIEAFEKARDGFSNFYCPLFCRYAKEDKNLADYKDWDRFQYLRPVFIEKHKVLAGEILQFLRKFTMREGGMIPTPTRSKNIFDMTFKELERDYFKGLLDLNHGKTNAVAKQAGLAESTCRDRLTKLKLIKSKRLPGF